MEVAAASLCCGSSAACLVGLLRFSFAFPSFLLQRVHSDYEKAQSNLIRPQTSLIDVQEPARYLNQQKDPKFVSTSFRRPILDTLPPDLLPSIEHRLPSNISRLHQKVSFNRLGRSNALFYHSSCPPTPVTTRHAVDNC